MAYFVGMAIGKHKLCTHLSPKKSKEGAVGGVLGSVLFCGIFAYFMEPDIIPECMIIAVVGSVVAQLGIFLHQHLNGRWELKIMET